MSKIRDTFERLGAFLSTNLYGVLAGVVMAAALLGYGVLFSTSIGPALQAQNAVNAQLAGAKRTLVMARQVQEEPIESLRVRAANAQATRAAIQAGFFTDAESVLLVDALYQYASAAGVTIVDLQSTAVITQPTLIPIPTPTVPPTPLPRPTGTPGSGPTPTGPARTGVPAAASPTFAVLPTATPIVGDIYRIKPMRMVAQGPSRKLVDFAAQIRESAKNLVITNLNISGGDGRVGTLTMDLSVYTSMLPSDSIPYTQPAVASGGPSLAAPTAVTGGGPVPAGPTVVALVPPAVTLPRIPLPVQVTPQAVPSVGLPPNVTLPPPPPMQGAATPAATSAAPPMPTFSNVNAGPPVPPVAATTAATSAPATAKGLEIPIRPGGTAVSLPYSFFTASTLAAAINAQGGTVAQVDEWTGNGWRSYAVGKGGSDFRIAGGKGYVVRANAASTWIAPAMIGSAPATLHFDAGWSLIGPLPCKDGAKSCFTASSFAKAINAKGGAVTQMSALQDGQWQQYSVGGTTNDFQIVVGQGYLVLSTKAVDCAP